MTGLSLDPSSLVLLPYSVLGGGVGTKETGLWRTERLGWGGVYQRKGQWVDDQEVQGPE